MAGRRRWMDADARNSAPICPQSVVSPAIAARYSGSSSAWALAKPYAWYDGREQTRVIVRIEPERISSVP